MKATALRFEKIRRLADRSLPTPKFRIALYSHDTMGLGHMRRNLLIAKALAASPFASAILMLAGAREAGAFTFPAGVDCLTMPSLYKQSSGDYQSRHLNVSLKEVIKLRANILRVALESFEPDLLIVDTVPRGAVHELDPALRHLRTTGRTRCVLGLRDVRDDPAAVQREWRREGSEQAVHDYYDEVWIYGDRNVYDLVKECGHSCEVATKARFTGYLDAREWLPIKASSEAEPLAGLGLPAGTLALCMVGGGQDGAQLCQAFAAAELPPGYIGVLVPGPFMPEEARRAVHARAKVNPRLRVFDFIKEPAALLDRAERVIIMGGYNSVCEALSFEKRALIVPRVSPRLEQWIRAERLQGMGLADMLHPDEVRPQALSAWLARDVPQPQTRTRIDLNGLTCLQGMAMNLLEGPRKAFVYFH